MMYQKFFNKIRKSRRSEWIGAKQKDMQLSFFPSLNQSSAADKTGLSLILFCSLAFTQQVLQIIFQLVSTTDLIHSWPGSTPVLLVMFEKLDGGLP